MSKIFSKICKKKQVKEIDLNLFIGKIREKSMNVNPAALRVLVKS